MPRRSVFRVQRSPLCVLLATVGAGAFACGDDVAAEEVGSAAEASESSGASESTHSAETSSGSESEGEASATSGDGDGNGDGDGDGDGDSIISELEIVENTQTHAGGSECIEVACPAEKLLLSGGAASAPGIRLTRTWPKDTATFEICGESALGGEWTVQATCATVSTSTSFADYQELVTLGAGPCISAACADGSTAVGGGAIWNEPGLPDGSASLPGSATPDPGFGEFSFCGWAGSDSTWEVRAVCVEGLEAERVQITPTHPGTGLDAEVCISIGCASSQQLLGGGGLWTAQVSPTVNKADPDGSMWRVCAAHDQPIEWWAIAVCTDG